MAKIIQKRVNLAIGVVGCEAKKFTPETEAKARLLIRKQIGGARLVISGACHLGGIDLWSIEEAKKLGILTQEFPPKSRNWEGYKDRNIQIAKASDRVICLTVRKLPGSYRGMRFDLCYHCGTRNHVKSGGCWTVKYAIEKLAKGGEVFVIEEDEDESGSEEV